MRQINKKTCNFFDANASPVAVHMPNRRQEVISQQASKVIFLHIHKTAGMSLRGLFVKNYRGVPHFNTELKELSEEGWQKCLERIGRMPADDLERCRVFKGHMPFGLHKILPGQAEYITFLRDPVKRVISHYRMQCRKKVLPLDLVIDPSQKDWNLGKHPIFFRSLDNGQTRSIAGADLNLPFGACTEKHLHQAKSNLDRHFKFVGLTEQFDLSLLLLKRLCGWHWHFYVPDNRAADDSICFSPAVLKEIRDLNRFDYELYRYAQERFERLVDSYGLSLKTELALFRSGNYLHQSLHIWRHRIKRRLGVERRKAMISDLSVKDRNLGK